MKTILILILFAIININSVDYNPLSFNEYNLEKETLHLHLDGNLSNNNCSIANLANFNLLESDLNTIVWVPEGGFICSALSCFGDQCCRIVDYPEEEEVEEDDEP